VYDTGVKRPPNSLPLAAYVRVSTAGQAASGVGIAAQRAAITQAADKDGFEVGSWYEDAGKSGAKLQNRPGLQTALAMIATGALSGLVVAKIDRLGRSYDVMTLVGRAAHEGWRLLALDVGLDTTTAEGELVAGALTMAARFEWRRISQRQLEKHEELRRQGRRRGPAAVPPDVADRMRNARSLGWTFQTIADVATEQGIPPVRGKQWYPSSVRSAILTRERELAAQRTTARTEEMTS
jgi:DNA invertase Pin-like site-specific DNA recombinase